MLKQFYFKTSAGTIWIRPQPKTDRYWLGIDDQRLGTYYSPSAAADDVYTRHTGWQPLDALPRSELPRDLSRWTRGTPETPDSSESEND
jgi:hypothetical protein